MFNKRILNAIGFSFPLLSALIISGMLGASVNTTTNLFSTGVTLGAILVVGQLFLAFLIFKKHI